MKLSTLGILIMTFGALSGQNIYRQAGRPNLNPQLMNPGFAGIANFGETENFKYQRTSFNLDFLNTSRFSGNSTTPISLSWDRCIPKLGGGLGLIVNYDNPVFSEISEFAVLYNFIIPVNRKWKLSLGTQFGYFQYSFDTSKLILSRPDPLIDNFNPKYKAINTHFGAVLSSKKSFFALGVRDLPIALSKNNGVFTAIRFRCYNLYFQKNFHFKERLMLAPYLAVRANKYTDIEELGILAKYNKIIFSSAMRFNKLRGGQFGIGLGYEIKNFMINYHIYDFIKTTGFPVTHQFSIIHHWALPFNNNPRPLITPEF